MNRLPLLVATSLACCGAAAAQEWTDMARNENMVVYIDKASIAKTGNMVKVWKVVDYKTAKLLRGKSYLSTKTAIEYDCIERQYRTYFYAAYATRMAAGGEENIVGWYVEGTPISKLTQLPSTSWQFPPSEWESMFMVPLDNPIREFVCNRK